VLCVGLSLMEHQRVIFRLVFVKNRVVTSVQSWWICGFVDCVRPVIFVPSFSAGVFRLLCLSSRSINVSFCRLVFVKIAFLRRFKAGGFVACSLRLPFCAIDYVPLVSLVSLMFYVSGYVPCFA